MIEDLFTAAATAARSNHSILAQTGWVRPGPQTVCQDWSVLNRLQHFVYELSDAFMDFTRARMSIDLRTCDCGFAKACAVYAPGAPAKEGYIRATQARLHDLWELYQTWGKETA